ncbi:MAG: glycosyltransferase, partial [Methanocellales archaeon]|nr:glycosyltransferase [Methanocellales archaeon]
MLDTIADGETGLSMNLKGSNRIIMLNDEKLREKLGKNARERAKDKMKIAQVCPRYHPDIGGVETHVKEISERLVKRGFEVEVICTDPTGRLPKHEMINGVKVTRFRSIAPNDAFFFA